MKFAVLLVLVGAASAQFFGRRPQFRPPFRPQFQFRAPPNRFAAPANNFNGGGGGGAGGHGTSGNSEYHYSWLADGGQKYSHSGAVNYCQRLGGGWQAVSIEDERESSFINGVITGHRQDYIWTSGTKRGPRNFVWGSGRPVTNLNWSRTGLNRVPQPDNREGNENCLAILNNFYPNDGVTWHDVGCSHTKPVVCERPLNRG